MFENEVMIPVLNPIFTHQGIREVLFSDGSRESFSWILSIILVIVIISKLSVRFTSHVQLKWTGRYWLTIRLRHVRYHYKFWFLLIMLSPWFFFMLFDIGTLNLVFRKWESMFTNTCSHNEDTKQVGNPFSYCKDKLAWLYIWQMWHQ